MHVFLSLSLCHGMSLCVCVLVSDRLAKNDQAVGPETLFGLTMYVNV